MQDVGGQLVRIARRLKDRARHEPVGGSVGLGRERRVDAIVDDRNAIGVCEPTAPEIIGGGVCVARDVCRGLEARQHLPRQPSRQSRVGDVGLDERQERVGIVARHDGPRGREHVDQMRIAVIHDVEHVELVLEPDEPALVIPEPVDDPVGPVETLQAAKTREARQPANHRRPQQYAFDATRQRRAQVVGKHGRDEIHARPTLFAKITDNAYAHD